MVHWLVHFTIAVLLTSTGWVHAQSPRPLRDRVIWITPGSAVATAGIRGMPSGALSHHICPGATCTVHVGVTVDKEDVTGRTCEVTVPFVVILKKTDVTITWKLTEKGSNFGAKFRNRPLTGDGIRIHRDATTLDHFRSRDHTDLEFKWQRNFDAKDWAHVYLYDINIEHSHGDGRCDVPDPIIVSRD